MIAYLSSDNGGTEEPSTFDKNIIKLGYNPTKFQTSEEMIRHLHGLKCDQYSPLKQFLMDDKNITKSLNIPKEVFDDPKLKCIDLICKYPINEEEIFTTAGHLSPVCRKYTSCFTKSYGRYWSGTGSILCVADDLLTRHTSDEYQTDSILEAYKESRYFHPLEVAALMGFQPSSNFNDNQCPYSRPPSHPDHQCNILKTLIDTEVSRACCCNSFNIPDDINPLTMYKMLGNSLNPQVVSLIIRHAFLI